MRHEHTFLLRPSRPPVCRKRRFSSRLNPAGRFAGLDENRLSSGWKISRARDGSTSGGGFEQEQQAKKNSRGKVSPLTGIAFFGTRFSLLPHTVFRFWASRFLLGTPPGKCKQSDRKFSRFRPADVRVVDRNSSRFHLGIKRFSDQAETGFRLPGLPVPVARISGSTFSHWRFPPTAFSVFGTPGFSVPAPSIFVVRRPRLRSLLTAIPFCADRTSVFQVPPLFVTGWKPYYIPLHPAKELRSLDSPAVFGAALLTLQRQKP